MHRSSVILAVLLVSSIASAQDDDDPPPPPPARMSPTDPYAVATPPPAHAAAAKAPVDTAEAPPRPVAKRFVSGFRLGWMYIANIDKPQADRDNMSLAQKFGLKSPNMFLMGYEGFYRVVSHSWLNVLMVGNVSVVGLEQSKFIPSANGLIGFEFNRGFQVGVGINVTPDTVAPTHMVAAAGWTPTIGSIQTPIHFIYIPDPDGNYRMGATLGMNW